MYRSLLILLSALSFMLSSSCHVSRSDTPAINHAQSTLAFGSCLRQWQPQPVWEGVKALNPKAFVFLGDNIYSDVGDYKKQVNPYRIGTAYADLLATDDFRAFKQYANTVDLKIFGIWDDHDYGVNDGGASFPYKLASKSYFLEFFNLDTTATGDASHPGIYHSRRLELSGLDVQLILLDTRSFRSPLKKSADSPCPETDFVPNVDDDATVLGSEQWLWLEQQLAQPADLRIIASSIQVIAEQHCYEKWANFPRERQKLFSLIEHSRAAGVVFISGDRHMAEISRTQVSGRGYPLYEITSSGLNSAMGIGGRVLLSTDNHHRMGKAIFSDNFGSISVVKTEGEYQLVMQIFSVTGEVVREELIPLTELSFTGTNMP